MESLCHQGKQDQQVPVTAQSRTLVYLWILQGAVLWCLEQSWANEITNLRGIGLWNGEMVAVASASLQVLAVQEPRVIPAGGARLRFMVKSRPIWWISQVHVGPKVWQFHVAPSSCQCVFSNWFVKNWMVSYMFAIAKAAQKARSTFKQQLLESGRTAVVTGRLSEVERQ